MNEEFEAKLFDYEQDTVYFDLILVMDKFTAGDVMREVNTLSLLRSSLRYVQDWAV